jgi:diguanylate cyclase (GGDEF)-like protein
MTGERHAGATARTAVRVARGDPFFAEAGLEGEWLVAQLRLALVVLAGVIQLLPGPDARGRWFALQASGVALVLAGLVLVLAWRGRRRWLAFASSAADVTLVSGALAAFASLDRPGATLGSPTLFDVYFLALGATSLRYDWRVCAGATLLALGQYAAVAAWAASAHPGTADASVATARLGLLAAAGAVSTAIVLGARRLRRLSTTDRLTGVLNRGAFDERLAEEASRARRYDHPLTVAVVDVDQFKLFNEAHGHAGGDVVLRVLADTLASSVRRSDTVARYGGEEFALVFPETPAKAAMGRLEALRRVIAAVPIDTGRGEGPVHVTVSIGAASWPEDGADISEVLARADARCFEAKRLGRNRTAGPDGA